MTVPRRRWLQGFSRADGTDLIEFSRLEHEWTPDQALAVPIATVVGAGYGVNLLGAGPVPKRTGRERARFLVRHGDGQSVDQQVDAMNAALRRYGTGKLWQVIEGYGAPVRRWAWASAVTVPGFQYGVRDREFVPVVVEFVRVSDWHAEALTSSTLGIGASPAVLEVVNHGTADALALTVELAAHGASGYQNPQITNTTTGESVAFGLTAAGPNDRLRIDTEHAALQRSTDGGTTWMSAYGAATLGATQTALMSLVPGSNYIEVTSGGTPDMTLTVAFHAPYE